MFGHCMARLGHKAVLHFLEKTGKMIGDGASLLVFISLDVFTYLKFCEKRSIIVPFKKMQRLIIDVSRHRSLSRNVSKWIHVCICFQKHCLASCA